MYNNDLVNASYIINFQSKHNGNSADAANVNFKNHMQGP